MRQPRWLITLCLMGALGTGTLLAVRELRRATTPRAHSLGDRDRLSQPPLWVAPSFTLVDQTGAKLSSDSLRAKPWVANFIFTQCKSICPLLTAKMVRLQRQLPGVDARFVSFSVDPDHDTPAVLADYAQRWNADERRWTLLVTDPASLAAVAAGFRVTAERNTATDPLNPIVHSGAFVLVDEAGMVRGIYDSEDPEDFRALRSDLRSLAHLAPAAAPQLASSGEALAQQLSCTNCHDHPELAPPLRGLAGRQRPLEASNVVTADAAYVRESILAPDSRRVAGYPLHMPSYEGVIDETSLRTLVDYVLSLKAEETPTAPAPSRIEIDPVCRMEVRVTDASAISAAYGGQTFYFCSDLCRTRFTASPASFVGAAPRAGER